MAVRTPCLRKDLVFWRGQEDVGEGENRGTLREGEAAEEGACVTVTIRSFPEELPRVSRRQAPFQVLGAQSHSRVSCVASEMPPVPLSLVRWWPLGERRVSWDGDSGL